MNLKTEITKIHYNKKAEGLIFNLLKFASIFYGIASGMKNLLYDKKILKPKIVPAKVISIGNVTTGGVGKTPVVAELAKYFIAKGEKVAIVSRGYGGALSNKQINVISDGKKTFYNASQAGDEPYWLATNVEGGIVITSKNRVAASQYAISEFGVSRIILDDGFQHRKLHRDLDIILIDSEKMFGNEQLLPAGPLREGKEAFSRVDRIVMVSKNTDHSRAEKLSKITAKKMDIKTILCYTEPDYIYNIKTGEILEKGTRITAMCAIGQPEQFYKFLSNYNVVNKLTFDDHHSYNEADLPEGIIVTTEKDAVKLLNFNREDIYALKLRTKIDIEKLLEE